MKDYLMINNKKIDLTPEQVREIECSFCYNKTALKNVAVGDTFWVGGLEFIVLEQNAETTSVILKDLWKVMSFDGFSNDYKNSQIRSYLNTVFYQEVASIVGDENIVEHSVNLIADDGRIEYQKCKDKVSLLTCGSYRKYIYVLSRHKVDKWWWLATAYSTDDNGCNTDVRCVNNAGTLSCTMCRYYNGVRPFCILKNDILVSQ